MDVTSNVTSGENLLCCLAKVTPIPSEDGCGCNSTNGSLGNAGNEHSDGHSPSMGPPLYMYIYVTLLYIVVFVVGVLGNILVIHVVARTKSMRRRMNYFLVSLSIADLQLLIVGLPIALMEFYSKDRWYLGEFMCRAESLLENTSHHCSVLTLLAIGFERYYAICHPLRETAGSRFTSPHILIPIVWVLSCIVSLPFTIISNTREEEFYDGSVSEVCFTDMNSSLARVYLALIFTIFLAIPLLLLTVMYTAIIMTLAASTLSGNSNIHITGTGNGAGNSNNGSLSSLNHPSRNIYRMDNDHHYNNSRAISSRRQVVRMMMAVMALYFVCLFPLRCFQLWMTFGTRQQLVNLGFERYLNLAYCMRILMYVNSAGNPIIYGLLSTNFRSAFWKSINCCGNRLDGMRYNTTYYSNASNKRRSYGPGALHGGNAPSRTTHATFASPSHRMDSQENLTSFMNTEQMLPLTESVPETQMTRASPRAAGRNKNSYQENEVIVNPGYQPLKTEVRMNNHQNNNGNVYV